MRKRVAVAAAQWAAWVHKAILAGTEQMPSGELLGAFDDKR
jgi:hypothetical protein